jgi:trimethylamine--corrinoid protein Co-methyltransferase
MPEERKNNMTDLEVNKTHYVTPQFTLVTQDEIEQIHLATLDILENVGNTCYSEKALEYLKKAGCRVNGKLVKIPAGMVQEALDKAPKRLTIYNQKGERAMELERRRSYFGNAPTAAFTRDIYSGKRRETTLADVELHTRIVDALPQFDFVMPPGTPTDVPSALQDNYMLRATVLNTNKPIVHLCSDERGIQDAFDIAVAVAGSREALYDRPFLISYPEPSSPLFVPKEVGDKIVKSAQLRIPMTYLSAPMIGATSPITPAGCVVQGNAECLFGLVISQLVKPGVPFGIGVFGHGFNMHNGNAMMCDPSAYIAYNIFAQVAQYYGLYTWGLAGACDSKTVDGQAAIETALTILINALSGLNLIHDSGFLESCMVESAEIFVIANEMISWVKHFMKGADFSRESLAKEVISNVGPMKSYLETDHTLHHFREILWDTKLFDRGFLRNWVDAGSKSFEQRVKEKAIELAETSKPEPLQGDIVEKIDRIIERSKAERKK